MTLSHRSTNTAANLVNATGDRSLMDLVSRILLDGNCNW